MIRKEEIIQAAKQKEKEVYFTQIVKEARGVNSAYGIGFLEGAEWADKSMIDKACEWWEDELSYPSMTTEEIKFYKNKVNDFRKAMLEEE